MKDVRDQRRQACGISSRGRGSGAGEGTQSNGISEGTSGLDSEVMEPVQAADTMRRSSGMTGERTAGPKARE
jgi:hypothetical protein